MKKIEEHNTLVFICDIKANKRQIKQALKTLYDVDCVKINTLVRYGMPFGKCSALHSCAANNFADKDLQARRLEEGFRAVDPGSGCIGYCGLEAVDCLDLGWLGGTNIAYGAELEASHIMNEARLSLISDILVDLLAYNFLVT